MMKNALFRHFPASGDGWGREIQAPRLRNLSPPGASERVSPSLLADFDEPKSGQLSLFDHRLPRFRFPPSAFRFAPPAPTAQNPSAQGNALGTAPPMNSSALKGPNIVSLQATSWSDAVFPGRWPGLRNCRPFGPLVSACATEAKNLVCGRKRSATPLWLAAERRAVPAKAPSPLRSAGALQTRDGAGFQACRRGPGFAKVPAMMTGSRERRDGEQPLNPRKSRERPLAVE